MKIVNKETGKAILWIRGGATVCGPGTYDNRETLKAHGGHWDNEKKGWTFDGSFERAERVLEAVLYELGDGYTIEKGKPAGVEMCAECGERRATTTARDSSNIVAPVCQRCADMNWYERSFS